VFIEKLGKVCIALGKVYLLLKDFYPGSHRNTSPYYQLFFVSFCKKTRLNTTAGLIPGASLAA